MVENESKRDVLNYSRCKFHSFSLYKIKGIVKISIHSKNRTKFKKRIREIHKRNRGINIELVIRQLNVFTRAWINLLLYFFLMINYLNILSMMQTMYKGE